LIEVGRPDLFFGLSGAGILGDFLSGYRRAAKNSQAKKKSKYNPVHGKFLSLSSEILPSKAIDRTLSDENYRCGTVEGIPARINVRAPSLPLPWWIGRP
jgi:hypothetical protein